jgi:hypothetical protein
MNLDKLFDEIETLEADIKTKFPAPKGRVILANIKTEIDYEFGKPSDETEEIRWGIEYRDRLQAALK